MTWDRQRQILDKSHLYTFLSPWTRQDHSLPSQELFPHRLGWEEERICGRSPTKPRINGMSF